MDGMEEEEAFRGDGEEVVEEGRMSLFPSKDCSAFHMEEVVVVEEGTFRGGGDGEEEEEGRTNLFPSRDCSAFHMEEEEGTFRGGKEGRAHEVLSSQREGRGGGDDDEARMAHLSQPTLGSFS